MNFNFTFQSCSLSSYNNYLPILVRHVLCIVLAEKKLFQKQQSLVFIITVGDSVRHIWQLSVRM